MDGVGYRCGFVREVSEELVGAGCAWDWAAFEEAGGGGTGAGVGWGREGFQMGVAWWGLRVSGIVHRVASVLMDKIG